MLVFFTSGKSCQGKESHSFNTQGHKSLLKLLKKGTNMYVDLTENQTISMDLNSEVDTRQTPPVGVGLFTQESL